MGGPVMRRHVTVLDFDQNIAVRIDKDRAERMVAVGDGAAGDIERAAQKMFVEFRGRHIKALAGSVASSFETARSLSSGAHSRDPLAPPQDEVLDPYGEERGNDARLRTMLRIALRTTRP